MKGKAPKKGAMHHTAYAGGDSDVAKEAMQPTNGFKRGGKTGMKAEGVMSTAHAGRKPRKSGGGVFSSAAAGTPRGKASHY
jgi:hypothetical protein